MVCKWVKFKVGLWFYDIELAHDHACIKMLEIIIGGM